MKQLWSLLKAVAEKFRELKGTTINARALQTVGRGMNLRKP
jgi:hypothetical protein